MSMQHFRTALGGFNREDVVRYIEYLNNQHKSQLEQLNTQLQAAKSQAASGDPALREQLDAALAKIAQLEAQLAGQSNSSQELETYRRAERAERLAQERAKQISTQANAVLADATAKAQEASQHIGSLAAQATTQLEACRDAIAGYQDVFRDAVSALGALQPEIQE